jgi:hypothetical protein
MYERPKTTSPSPRAKDERPKTTNSGIPFEDAGERREDERAEG